MLLDPDPADWINWRRTLDGWGYSPLDQIDTENAHRLQLAWSWAIGTEGRPEPNPLVYDGVLYIASPYGIVEALDAATGELLWRYRHEHEAEELTGIVTTRNLAIYDDKVYLTTVDAHRRRPRRPDRGRRVERRRRGLPPWVPLYGRSHRRRRKSDSQHERLRALPRSQGHALFHLGAGRADGARRCGGPRRWPARASRAATPGATPR